MNDSLGIRWIALVVACLLCGCAGLHMPERALEEMRGRSIDDIATAQSSFSFGEDKDGNKVAYRNRLLEQPAGFHHRHAYMEDFEALCRANDGTFMLDKNSAGRDSGAPGDVPQQNLPMGMRTARFWTDNGIYAPEMVRQTDDRQGVVSARRMPGAAVVFDSAIKSESVGTFACMANTTQKPRWRLNQDLRDARSEVSRVRPDDKTADDTMSLIQTVIMYEPPPRNGPYRGGAPRLSGHARDMTFPSKGFYVVLESRRFQWRIASMRPFNTRSGGMKQVLSGAPVRTNANQEILVTSQDGSLIIPAYLDDDTKFFYSEYEVNRNPCSVDNIKFSAKYSVCNSAYGDAPRETGSAVKGNLLVLAGGPNPDGSYLVNQKRTVAFMPDKFEASLASAGVVKAINEMHAGSSTPTAAAPLPASTASRGGNCPDGYASYGMTTQILQLRDGSVTESIQLNNGNEVTLSPYKADARVMRKPGDPYCVDLHAARSRARAYP